jgi:hypothetical protein
MMNPDDAPIQPRDHLAAATARPAAARPDDIGKPAGELQAS